MLEEEDRQLIKTRKARESQKAALNAPERDIIGVFIVRGQKVSFFRLSSYGCLRRLALLFCQKIPHL